MSDSAAGRVTTVDRIVAGASRALGRFGSKKVTLSEICREAGVSRPTFYKYFASKEEVLEAISERLERGFADRIAAAIELRPAADERLVVVAEALLAYPTQVSDMAAVLQSDPEYMVQRTRLRMPYFVRTVTDALGPAFEGRDDVDVEAVGQTLWLITAGVFYAGVQDPRPIVEAIRHLFPTSR